MEKLNARIGKKFIVLTESKTVYKEYREQLMRKGYKIRTWEDGRVDVIWE